MITDCKTYKLDIPSTASFSKLINHYYDENLQHHLKPFYKFEPSDKGMTEALHQRMEHNQANREILVEVLKDQYHDLEKNDLVNQNIESLINTNTFTITTAHQPNLMTGHLYFFYKIIHAVKLANHLNSQNPQQHFVPIYYIGSEDNDLEELGNFHFNEHHFIWQTDQKGAVGRMTTHDLQSLLQSFYKVIGPLGIEEKELKDTVAKAFAKGNTITYATRYLIHALLGRLGVICLDPDDKRLKQEFASVMESELFSPKAYDLVQTTSAQLNEEFKAQAFARPINLFYLKDDIRARIEHHDGVWEVVNTDITFDEVALRSELRDHPERFSPNVILRGLYQETILPNVAFIGGGSEVAYWMQLKAVFEHYQVFFPVLILRQSMLIVDQKSLQNMFDLKLNIALVFKKTNDLIDYYIDKNKVHDISLEQEKEALQSLFNQIAEKATQVNASLAKSAQAALTKSLHQFNIVEQKMKRGEKMNLNIQINRIQTFKKLFFPNDSLQERHDNFLAYYVSYGSSLIDYVYEATDPYGKEFAVLALNKS